MQPKAQPEQPLLYKRLPTTDKLIFHKDRVPEFNLESTNYIPNPLPSVLIEKCINTNYYKSEFKVQN